jgi:hypothetical protein
MYTLFNRAILLLTGFLLVFSTSIAFAKTPENLLITKDSIGIAKVGKPLKDFRDEAKEIGYTIKEVDQQYIVYDRNDIPILYITVFLKNKKTRPIRTIKTTSSRFLLDSGKSLIGSTLGELSEDYSGVSIFRVNTVIECPEIVDFKGWPFSEKAVIGPYIIKYEATLNKIRDEYGNVKPVGIYPTEFSLYTNKFIPEAKIESFLIEGIKPKVKFKGIPAE